MIETAVRGGTVVTAAGTRRADVGINGGRIASVGDVGAAAAEIDATGLLVLPGCVDLHTHLASTPSWTPLDGFETGTRAAIAGGVTTVVSMVYQEDGSLRRGVERAFRDAAPSIADYAFHIVVTDPSASAIGELPALVAEGHAGLKVFMVMPQFAERTNDFLRLYVGARVNGMVVAVHAEDHATIARATASLYAHGTTAARSFPESRPVEAEVIAVQQAIEHTAITGASLYLVHLSSRRAVAAVALAKARGAPLFGETRPLYLYLTREQFEREDAALWIGQPPLREQQDVDALWAALAAGSLDTVATDHIPRTRAQKLAPGLAFDKIPPGVSNLETLLPMLYSEGVRKDRLTVERLVDVLATTPARIAGLRGKGEIAVGKDADLVLFDPERTRTIAASELHSAADYDPYEGWSVTGWPRTVLLRGEIAYDGEIRASAGSGQFTPRSPLP
ncbi:MAG TPA: amidohydrolase family protein [Candidatus Limnocylindrales bacterium]|nr:amidohydrolase family protein [Candidatus Limnocylindrales bacterium]